MTFLAKIKENYFNLKNNNSGFLSLAELMVTMSIVSTVAAVGAGQLDDVMPTARDAQRHANIHQVEVALNIYYDDKGAYPVSLGSEATEAGWDIIQTALEGETPKPYMPEVPTDPLNTGENVFKYWSDGQTFKLVYETEDTVDASPRVRWGM